MGSVLIKILNITKMLPIVILQIIKYNIINKSITAKKTNDDELFVEWGQFVELDKPLNNDNREYLL
tara:strand:+ start:841 stop:1038 length:198 start_codon:yes stop_codon:yes gene_type:complete